MYIYNTQHFNSQWRTLPGSEIRVVPPVLPVPPCAKAKGCVKGVGRMLRNLAETCWFPRVPRNLFVFPIVMTGWKRFYKWQFVGYFCCHLLPSIPFSSKRTCLKYLKNTGHPSDWSNRLLNRYFGEWFERMSRWPGLFLFSYLLFSEIRRWCLCFFCFFQNQPRRATILFPKTSLYFLPVFSILFRNIPEPFFFVFPFPLVPTAKDNLMDFKHTKVTGSDKLLLDHVRRSCRSWRAQRTWSDVAAEAASDALARTMDAMAMAMARR